MAFELVDGRNGSWVLDSCILLMYRRTRLPCIATLTNVPLIWSTESGMSLGSPNDSTRSSRYTLDSPTSLFRSTCLLVTLAPHRRRVIRAGRLRITNKR
ncbi:hypothetical protein CGRA01v4_10403 [Colletotrichum graminicola]|nr:hypothetical protein CGRA01v4_10403 [Colletotrichum graminicola]